MNDFLIIPHTVDEKIRWSKEAYLKFKDVLLNDTKLIRLLNELEESIAESRKYLDISGISQICSICDKEEGGSCCGKGIENRYTPTVLLINLLLGINLPQTPLNNKSCLFLSTNGCTLMARDTICINYICKKIEKTVPREILSKLREIEGVELEKLFFADEYIKDKLKGKCL